MQLVSLLVICVLSILLCKSIGAGLFILFFLKKGRDGTFEDWSRSVNAAQLTQLLGVIFLFSAAAASLAAFGALHFLEFHYALHIALLLFGARLLLSFFRYRRKGGRAYFTEQLKKLHEAGAC